MQRDVLFTMSYYVEIWFLFTIFYTPFAPRIVNIVSKMVVFIALAFSISAIGDNRYKLLRSKNLDYSVVRRTQYDIEVAANTGMKK
jgi:hypothetical protein